MPAKHSDTISELRSKLVEYARRWPAEAEHTLPFLELLDEALSTAAGTGAVPASADDAAQHSAATENHDPFLRERLAGHFTASAWLIDRDGRRVLLTHHRKLGRWLQLGGHADGDRDLPQVALREAEEESGLTGLSVDTELFDVDRHWIPERREVPGHWHYDMRYVVRAGDNENYVISEESLDLAWREIAELPDDPGSDDSMRRMANKWLTRQPALPEHKHDVDAVSALADLPVAAWLPYAPQLLTWLQDANWPVAQPVARLLRQGGREIVPAIAQVLDGDDPIWKYWCISLLIADLPIEAVRDLSSRLQTLATAPNAADASEEVNIAAQEVLAKFASELDH